MNDMITVASLAKMIDHSLLHPTMTDADLETGCRLAVRYAVASVCIKPYAVPMARELLRGSGVLVCTVIGFPHGGNTTALKVMEAEEMAMAGATEIDMVINIGKALGNDWAYVKRDIAQVNAACLANGAILKVIFENDFMDNARIETLCRMCGEVDVAFVKTSTGYGFVKQADGAYNYKGATDAQLALMRRCAPAKVQIKAAGGVRTLDDLLRVRALGVTRVGATATQQILEAARKRFEGRADTVAPETTAPAGY